MANSSGHGGYRKPAHPAPVSGPGAHSKRTDGQPIRDLPNADYGEGAAFRSVQQAAPLARQSPTPSAGLAAGGAPAPPVVPMGAPSEAPHEPVTNGAAMGPGAGPDALGLDQTPPDVQDARALQVYKMYLIQLANSDTALPGAKAFARAALARM